MYVKNVLIISGWRRPLYIVSTLYRKYMNAFLINSFQKTPRVGFWISYNSYIWVIHCWYGGDDTMVIHCCMLYCSAYTYVVWYRNYFFHFWNSMKILAVLRKCVIIKNWVNKIIFYHHTEKQRNWIYKTSVYKWFNLFQFLFKNTFMNVYSVFLCLKTSTENQKYVN